MYDQSYNAHTLTAQLRRRDFDGISKSAADAHREALVQGALAAISTTFGGLNPIQAFHLKRKPAFRVAKTEDDLVVRKLTKNLRLFVGSASRGRDFIVRNLQRMLEEGVPYRVYRLDIKSFYESIGKDAIDHVSLEHATLGPVSKRLLSALMQHYEAMGGTGVPRGMALSAVLAELVMHRFDRLVSEVEGVYFYARYVDDILVVTNLNREKEDFLAQVETLLPNGLRLNESKKATLDVEKAVSTKTPDRFCGFIEYLGYKFSIYDPPSANAKLRPLFRRVDIDIANAKVDKLKRRIVRSFLHFAKSPNLPLLQRRLKLLTSNFSISDKNTGRKQLAGIYHGYPRLTPNSPALIGLDKFVRQAVLSGTGRLFARTRPLLSARERRSLLGTSFVRGFEKRSFIHFHPQEIAMLQECWLYD